MLYRMVSTLLQKIHIMHMEFYGINVGIQMMAIITAGLTEII